MRLVDHDGVGVGGVAGLRPPRLPMPMTVDAVGTGSPVACSTDRMGDLEADLDGRLGDIRQGPP